MAFSLYEALTNIIASLGTNPDERGLTTDEFKAKFDEAITAFKEWFNVTHIQELNNDKQRIGNNPSCSVYNTGNQPINSGVATAIQFDAEKHDSDTMHDNATNNTRITIKTAGKYSPKAYVLFDASATGYRQVYFYKNDSTVIGSTIVNAVSGGTQTQILAIAPDIDLAVDDYIEVRVNQTSGGALNVMANSIFSLTRVA